MMVKIETMQYSDKITNNEIALITKYILENAIDLELGLHYWLDCYKKSATLQAPDNYTGQKHGLIFKLCNN
jgi:hypothetical protein